MSKTTNDCKHRIEVVVVHAMLWKCTRHRLTAILSSEFSYLFTHCFRALMLNADSVRDIHLQQTSSFGAPFGSHADNSIETDHTTKSSDRSFSYLALITETSQHISTNSADWNTLVSKQFTHAISEAHTVQWTTTQFSHDDSHCMPHRMLYYSAKKLKLRRVLQTLSGAFERCSSVRL